MATVLPLRTTWIADSFRKRPCAMYEDNAVGNVTRGDGQKLWGNGTTKLDL